MQCRIPLSSECHVMASFWAPGCPCNQQVSEQVHSGVVQHIQKQSHFHLCLQRKPLEYILYYLILAVHFLLIGLVPYLCTLNVCSHMMLRSSLHWIDTCIYQFCTRTSYCMSSKSLHSFSHFPLYSSLSITVFPLLPPASLARWLAVLLCVHFIFVKPIWGTGFQLLQVVFQKMHPFYRRMDRSNF